MKLTRTVLIIMICLSLSAVSFASGSGHTHSHDKAKTSGKETTTQVAPNHLRIETKTINGVKARIDIITLDDIQKEGGKLFTHQISAVFTATKSGKNISDGSVALRFTKDHDDTGHFINLNPADKGFETYLFLAHKGEQHMMLAASLNNEKVRQFHFHFKVK